jgi:ribonuclease D
MPKENKQIIRYTIHKNDLPDSLVFSQSVAIDTETMGLNNHRDKLCLVQLSSGDGTAHLVQLDREKYKAPNLCKLLGDEKIEKIFHFARFDVAVIYKYLGIWVNPIYCTKIASKLARTYTDSHGLKDLCQELLNKKISKQQQSSDWGAENLSVAQMEYASLDVLHLHEIKEKLNSILVREGRDSYARRCFAFLQTRAEMDLAGWENLDIFAHGHAS